ncbi:hypothetical protein SAMN05216563_1317 [Phytobacter palmae]|nr:hypothetical protein SAMN05216563_1317 [Phytobacter palmae]
MQYIVYFKMKDSALQWSKFYARGNSEAEARAYFNEKHQGIQVSSVLGVVHPNDERAFKIRHGINY